MNPKVPEALDVLIAEPATPSAIERKMYRGTTTEASEEEDLFERERENSLRCESSSRQLPFANTSAGTWSLDEVKVMVEFML